MNLKLFFEKLSHLIKEYFYKINLIRSNNNQKYNKMSTFKVIKIY